MKKMLTLTLVLLMISLTGCSLTLEGQLGASPDQSAAASQTQGIYQTITPEETKKMMDNGDAAVIVDVRTAGEYNDAHLEGAINIPVQTLTDAKPAALPDTNAAIIVYCQTGNRSETAAKLLLELGYMNVYDMGGITDWPYETVSGEVPVQETAASGSGGILGAFKAEDIDGNAVDASVFGDHKLTMVNVWATFCGPCIDEMPELGKLNVAYADKGFQVVGIVIDAVGNDGVILPDMVDMAKEIIRKTGADYLHLLPSADLNDMLLYSISAVPTTIFVDADGNQIGEAYVGSRSGEEWAAIIDGLLEEVS